MGLQPVLLSVQLSHQHWHLDGAPHHVRPPQGLYHHSPSQDPLHQVHEKVDKVLASALPYGRYPILGPERVSVIGSLHK